MQELSRAGHSRAGQMSAGASVGRRSPWNWTGPVGGARWSRLIGVLYGAVRRQVVVGGVSRS